MGQSAQGLKTELAHSGLIGLILVSMVGIVLVRERAPSPFLSI